MDRSQRIDEQAFERRATGSVTRELSPRTLQPAGTVSSFKTLLRRRCAKHHILSIVSAQSELSSFPDTLPNPRRNAQPPYFDRGGRFDLRKPRVCQPRAMGSHELRTAGEVRRAGWIDEKKNGAARPLIAPSIFLAAPPSRPRMTSEPFQQIGICRRNGRPGSVRVVEGNIGRVRGDST